MLKGTDDIYLLVLLGMAGTLALSLALVLFYLRYQKRLLHQRDQLHEAGIRHQVELLNSTIQSQEAERKRIGRDLHDEVGGALANLRVSISGLARGTVPEGLKQEVVRCQQLADDIMNTVRTISHTLSPSGLELFGFADVLEELCEQRGRSSGIAISCSNEASELTAALPHDSAIALYRVVQELLTNTLKHAGATQVHILLRKNAGALVLEYTDDGKGMPPDTVARGMGMRNIESRLNAIGATHQVEEGGKGFRMVISVAVG
jgi:signal transduction histidine kinase